MGYHTNFSGRFNLDRALTVPEYNVLKAYASEKQGFEHNYGRCQWVPTEDGTGIEWDEGEKFNDYVEVLEHLIEKFLIPWGITVNGKVNYQGDELDDSGTIVVDNNAVSKIKKIFAGQKYECPHCEEVFYLEQATEVK